MPTDETYTLSTVWSVPAQW